MHLGRWIHTSAMLVGLSFLLGGCASVSQTSTQATLNQLLADPALLAQAKLLPAQITALALRMGFNNVHTVDDMVAAVSATAS